MEAGVGCDWLIWQHKALERTRGDVKGGIRKLRRLLKSAGISRTRIPGTGGPGELREVFLLHLQDTTSTAAAQQAVQQWQVDQPEWLQQFMEPPGVITKPFCMVSSSSQQQEGEEWYSGEAAVSTYHMHAWPVKDIGVPYLLRRQREALAVLLQQADERPLCWLQQQLLQIAPELEAAANAHRRRHSGSNAEALAVTARHASSSVAAAAVPGTEPHAYGVEPWMPALLHVRGNIQQQQQQQHTIHQECFIPCHPLSGAEAAEAVSSAVAVVCAYVELRDDRPVSAEEAAAVLQSVAVLEGVVEACLGSSLVWQFKPITALPTQWDGTLLALVSCLHAIHNFPPVTHTAATSYDPFGSSSSSSYPPVTTALLYALVLFSSRSISAEVKREMGLIAYYIIDQQQYWRLLSAHLVHYDLAHLLTNIGLLLPSCSALEAAQGPAAFTADLLLLAVTASTAYGAAALLRMGVLGQRSHYYSMVTVGASSLSFALMVWSGCRCRGSLTSFWWPVPPQFSWLTSLALTHLLIPQSSFMAHMTGVAAGLFRAYCIGPVLRSGRQLLRSAADSGRVLVTFGGGEELDGEELDGQPLLLQGTDSWRKALLRRFLANRGDTTDGLARSQATSDNYSRSRGHGSLVLPVPA